MVAGFIAWVKVAVSCVPVTTLLLPLVLVGTFVAPLPGLADPTVGLVAEAPEDPAAPGTAFAPGATLPPAAVPPPPPPPQPAAQTARNNAASHNRGLYELSNRFMRVS